MLKLGDFGCAVRLRGHQTEVGELAGIVGTHGEHMQVEECSQVVEERLGVMVKMND